MGCQLEGGVRSLTGGRMEYNETEAVGAGLKWED